MKDMRVDEIARKSMENEKKRQRKKSMDPNFWDSPLYYFSAQECF